MAKKNYNLSTLIFGVSLTGLLIGTILFPFHVSNQEKRAIADLPINVPIYGPTPFFG